MSVPRDLTGPECRVLGALIEKERATPQNYPLTLNALRLACNQSTNRDPVVDYDERTVDGALETLRDRGLTRIVYSTSNRAAKYRHVLAEQFHLGDAQLAVVCLLLLRGPQTLGELKGRSDRLHSFADLAAVQATIDTLDAHPDGPIVRRLDRRPGQKDARYAHLLAGEPVDTPAAMGAPHVPAASPPEAPPRSSTDTVADADALAALVREVAELRADLAALRDEFDSFRTAFD